MQNPFALTLLCVFVWSLWPNLAKMSNLKPSTITFFVVVFTALTAITMLYFKKDMNQLLDGSNSRGISIIILAAILNGIGMVTYSSLLTSHSTFDISKYVVMISCLMPVGTILFARLILGEHISTQKIISIVIIISGVYMLKKS